jgi:hypothetical protein
MFLCLHLCYVSDKILWEWNVNLNQKGSQMQIKSKRKAAVKKKLRVTATPIRGRRGVKVVDVDGETKLELRDKLQMPREVFGRLVDVSVRTIADVESKHKIAKSLLRNYLQLQRLYDSLSEVVDPEDLGAWFKNPNDAFGGLKPLEVIERGEIDRLWEMCYRLRSGMPG